MISGFHELQWKNDARTSPNRDYWVLRGILDDDRLLATGHSVLAYKGSIRDFLRYVLSVYGWCGLVAGLWPHYRKMASDSGKLDDLHFGA